MLFLKQKRFYDELYILNQFFTFVYLNELSANFKTEGHKVVEKLYEYLKKQAVYEEILAYSRKLTCENSQLNNEELKKFDEYLEDCFSEFIENMRESGDFSEIKNDYFEV